MKTFRPIKISSEISKVLLFISIPIFLTNCSFQHKESITQKPDSLTTETTLSVKEESSTKRDVVSPPPASVSEFKPLENESEIVEREVQKKHDIPFEDKITFVIISRYKNSLYQLFSPPIHVYTVGVVVPHNPRNETLEHAIKTLQHKLNPISALLKSSGVMSPTNIKVETIIDSNNKKIRVLSLGSFLAPSLDIVYEKIKMKIQGQIKQTFPKPLDIMLKESPQPLGHFLGDSPYQEYISNVAELTTKPFFYKKINAETEDYKVLETGDENLEVAQFNLVLKGELYRKNITLQKEDRKIKEANFGFLFESLASAIYKEAERIKTRPVLLTPEITKTLDLSKKAPLFTCDITNVFIDKVLKSHILLNQDVILVSPYDLKLLYTSTQQEKIYEAMFFKTLSGILLYENDESLFTEEDFESENKLHQKLSSHDRLFKNLVILRGNALSGISYNIDSITQENAHTVSPERIISHSNTKFLESNLVNFMFERKDRILEIMPRVKEYKDYRQRVKQEIYEKFKEEHFSNLLGEMDKILLLKEDVERLKESLPNLHFESLDSSHLSYSECESLASSYKEFFLTQREKIDELKKSVIDELPEIIKNESFFHSFSSLEPSEINTSYEDFPETFDEQKARILNLIKLDSIRTKNTKCNVAQNKSCSENKQLEKERFMEVAHSFFEELNYSFERAYHFLNEDLELSEKEVADRKLDLENNFSNTVAYKAFLKSFLLSLDPFTSVDVNPEYLARLSGGGYSGIGVQVTEIKPNSSYSYIEVKDVFPNSPAEKSGLKKGDIFYQYQDENKVWKSFLGLEVNRTISILKGPEDTTILVKIKRGEEILEVSLTRKKQKYPSKLTFTVIDVRKDDPKSLKVGVIKFPNFPIGLSTEVQKALKKAQEEEVDSLVLDLSSNPGGRFQAAVNTTGLFINEGIIVGTLNTTHKEFSFSTISDPDSKIYWTKPLTILINQESASASEILTGALKDYKRALVVGSPYSYGKFSVQEVSSAITLYGKEMNITQNALKSLAPYNIKITQKYYFNPRAQFLNGKGLESHIILSSLKNMAKEQRQVHTPLHLPNSFLSPKEMINKDDSWLPVESHHIDKVREGLEKEDNMAMEIIPLNQGDEKDCKKENSQTQQELEKFQGTENLKLVVDNNQHCGEPLKSLSELELSETLKEAVKASFYLHREILSTP